MDTKQLGKSDLRITPLGIGTWAIGGSGWEFGWGTQDDQESIAAIREGLDAGINWIDTAAVYGLGHSEGIVAKALDGVRQKPYVFTKCSLVWNDRGEVGHSLKADSIRRECEESLRRLKVDTIDLYQVHWPNPEEDIEEAMQTLAGLQAEGKVRYLGVSNFDVNQLRRAQAIAPITSLQPPYSLLNRRDRGGSASVCRARKHRRDRLLAHGIGALDGSDDPRADRGVARRRLAEVERQFSGTVSDCATCGSCGCSATSACGTGVVRRKSPSPGFCVTRRSRGPSWE